jgi:hypothetical protein
MRVVLTTCITLSAGCAGIGRAIPKAETNQAALMQSVETGAERAIQGVTYEPLTTACPFYGILPFIVIGWSLAAFVMLGYVGSWLRTP